MRLPIVLLALALPATARALCGPEAVARVAEGAPRDRVVIENRTPEDRTGRWTVVAAEIALEGSAGRLVLDTVRGGAGRGSPQRFRPVPGPVALVAEPDLPDGATRIPLAFEGFGPGARFAFTVDFDDTVSPGAGTTIEGAEIEGARFTARFRSEDGVEETWSGLFDGRGEARAAAPCVS